GAAYDDHGENDDEGDALGLHSGGKHHLVVQKAQPPFRAGHIQEGGKARAGDGADAADDHDEQYLIGHSGGVDLGLGVVSEHGEQGAAHPGEEGGDAEGEHLVPGEVDAHGLGGDLILPDGLEGTAVGGVDEHDDDDDAHRGDEQ